MENGNWKLEIGNWKMETRKSKIGLALAVAVLRHKIGPLFAFFEFRISNFEFRMAALRRATALLFAIFDLRVSIFELRQATTTIRGYSIYSRVIVKRII